ncbi:Mu transposase C-terminal domain-containing protein [Streptomyces rishiriensis]|uniref:Mu transposase C-terminal domain-containing protein n=1 Tax=Streptomyces rishiriensis TaxID=68264 RepID=UPI0033FB8457
MSAVLSLPVDAPDEPAGMLRPGMTVRWKGGRYLVGALQGANVHLAAMDDGGQDALVLVRILVSAPDFAVLKADGMPQEPEAVPDLSVLDRLDKEQLEHVRCWEKHVREVLTGRPVGARNSAFTPRHGYDPATTTRTARYALKAAELAAAGLTGSVATVQRKCLAYEAHGLLGLVDKRWLRTSTVNGNVDERVVALIRQEDKAQRGASAGTFSRLYKRVRTALRRAHPDEYRALMPARTTFYDLLKRLGISKESLEAAPGQGSDATAPPEPPYHPAPVSLLGERVEIDGTGLDVLARGDDGRPVAVELTYALDILSRSFIAGMIVPKSSGRKKGPGSRRRGGRSTRSLDAALLLGQAMAPLAARPGWSPQAMAANSELPYAQMLARDPRMAGAAARPVIRPKTVVVDNAKIFKARHFRDVCSMLGIEVESARERTPTDKAVIERTNASVKSMFSQFVAGYTGNKLATRGTDVEKERLWTLNELQDLWHEWVVTEWQRRPHEGLRSPFLPSLVLTPNQMYATAVAVEGTVPRPVTPDESRKLLLQAKRTVTRDGIKIGNRTYVSHRIREFKNRHTGIKGQGRRWPVYYNPYEPSRVWLYDHTVDNDPARSPWVPFDFKYQHLIRDSWTQYLWEKAADLVAGLVGREGSEEEVARAVDDLLARARRGPSPASTSAKPVASFVPQPLEITETPVNPYAGITRAEPGSVTPAPSLNIDAKDLFPGSRAALPPAAPDRTAPPAPPVQARPPRRRPASAGGQSLGGSAGDIFRELTPDPPEKPPWPHQDSPPPGQDPQET